MNFDLFVLSIKTKVLVDDLAKLQQEKKESISATKIVKIHCILPQNKIGRFIYEIPDTKLNYKNEALRSKAFSDTCDKLKKQTKERELKEEKKPKENRKDTIKTNNFNVYLNCLNKYVSKDEKNFKEVRDNYFIRKRKHET